jgi:hypothetical protein
MYSDNIVAWGFSSAVNLWCVAGLLSPCIHLKCWATLTGHHSVFLEDLKLQQSHCADLKSPCSRGQRLENQPLRELEWTFMLLVNKHQLYVWKGQYIGVLLYPLIQNPLFTVAWKKNWKIKAVNGSYVSKCQPSENGP